ncbi:MULTISPECIES: GNAT family N-acetyltransferase [Bacillaceae]|uniref:GNAT family N-acetyltransferase n=1 Tax=Bacillaceae TaxID=186817 RepID=UPI000C787219|nr:MULTISPECIES: GNAT family N-acetyltransferase [Bacillaceae]PLR67203.1 GNAT family N-acetyltransferase [Bacillus sp. UMB0893]
MITVLKGKPEHVHGIIQVCSDGYRNTYQHSHSSNYIDRVIEEFYNEKRISDEVIKHSRYWNGWFAAIEHNHVVGAGGGGMADDTTAELYVLYLDPKRRGEGIGTLLLNAITEDQKKYGASKQRVSVAKGNDLGIPFYEARGFTFQEELERFGNVKNETYKSIRYIRSI